MHSSIACGLQKTERTHLKSGSRQEATDEKPGSSLLQDTHISNVKKKSQTESFLFGVLSKGGIQIRQIICNSIEFSFILIHPQSNKNQTRLVRLSLSSAFFHIRGQPIANHCFSHAMHSRRTSARSSCCF